MGNGNKVIPKFILPIQVMIHDHIFEIFTLVVAIDPTIDLVVGIKKMYELEGAIDTRSSTFKFFARSPWMRLDNVKEDGLTLRPSDQKEIVLKVPYFTRLDGAAVVKFYWQGTVQIRKVNISNNRVTLQIINNTPETVKFEQDQILGILDLRSLGFYSISAVTLRQHLSSEYNFIAPKDFVQQHNQLVEEWDRLYKLQQVKQSETSDPYPWLSSDDPRRKMTDIQIFDEVINLSNAQLTKAEKKRLREIIHEHKDVFSLRDEIGSCPSMTINIEVLNDEPFFVRPFPISEADKPFMDQQMQRLVHLGILSKNTTAYTLPVMLISRKVTQDKRPVVDFRFLNSRIVRKNTATPLIRDILHTSIVDVKDAFHSIKLTPKSKEFCGILPCFGSTAYRYEVMPMGLSISPAKWMQYVDLLLEDVQDRSRFIAIIDDLLIHTKRQDHLNTLKDLFKAVKKHGLKLSPKKCQLAVTKMVYMGNEWEITPV